MAFLPSLRIFLYGTLWVFSVILLGLAGSRIHYTTHLSPFDPLNGGRQFYDPIVAELIVTACFTILWAPFTIFAIVREAERGIIYTFASELIGLFVLWLMYLVGAAISSQLWGDLHFCHQFFQCRLLSALVAFAWLNWVLLFFLALISLTIALRSHAFAEPMHGRFIGPRDSSVGVYPAPQTSEFRGSRSSRA
ncbi:hypothetical protein OF83DRAFT_90662 [Amylostereum chailletii]|nr:hypothetical protein OF83DRAFT_90662 [Amylostereum chailletii]